ncbi:MAG: SRPBCC family protein [Gemmatimonadaceae bacterium]
MSNTANSTGVSTNSNMPNAESKPEFVYVTYIKSTAEKVWNALTDGSITQQYWSNHNNASDWQVGSTWQHQDAGDSSIVDVAGKVLESNKPHRLVISWSNPKFLGDPAKTSRCAFDVVEDNGLVRLTVTHDQLAGQEGTLKGISGGWPMVLSSLKSLLESGEPLATIMERRDGKWATVRFA